MRKSIIAGIAALFLLNVSCPVLGAEGDVAVDLKITAGESGAVEGETLTAGYTLNGVQEDQVEITWLRSVDNEKKWNEIPGSNDSKYVISSEDLGAKLKFRISPKGGAGGTAVTSSASATVGNLAMSRPVSVSDRSGAKGDLSNLTDGNVSTAVTGGYSGTNNIAFMIDLGHSQTVTKLVARANQGSPKITGYRVQVSDAEQPGIGMDSPDWETVAEGEDKTNWKELQVLFEPVTARHIRFCVVGINTGWGGAFSLRQLEAYYSFTEPPEILLNGENPMLVPAGEPYTEPGAAARDQEGNDLTEKIVISGKVDTAEPADFSKSYTVTYTVQDRTGNVGTAEREVIVYSKSKLCKNVKVTLEGEAVCGGVLTGSYDWNPYFSDDSLCQWMRSTKDGFEVIPNVEGKTYTLGLEDIGKQVKFRVIPQSGGQMGTTSDSAPVTYGNLAHGKPVASNQKPKEGEEALQNVTDGSASTGFTGGYSGTNNMSVVVDLGSSRPVTRIIARSDQSTSKITGFKVEYSNVQNPSLNVDSGDWTLLEAREDTTNWKEQVFDFQRVNARYVRFCITAINEKWGGAFSFRELEAYNINTEPPVITLNGKEKQFVEVNSEFTDPGAQAVDQGGADLTERIVVGGDTVDVKTIGNYIVTYDVTDDSGLRAETVKRTVVVHPVDTEPPVITLNGTPVLRITRGSAYTEPGAAAVDNIDEEVEVKIQGSVKTDEIGEYTLVYTAADTKGNQAEAVIRTVWVVAEGEDVTQPEIRLEGESTVEVWQTFDYEEPGYMAADDRDGDLSAGVQVSGKVDTEVLGEYVLTYFVEDKAGNQQIARRRVNVIPIPKAYLDLQELDLGTQNLHQVTKDLILRIRGNRGSEITWISDKPSVVREDGTVIRSKSDQTVVLTATAVLEDQTFTRSFQVTVKGTGKGSSGGSSGGGGGGSYGGGVTVDSSLVQPPENTASPEAFRQNFSDMEDAAWAKLAVQELSSRGIINGVDDEHFEPNRSITREEFVKILSGLLELKSASEQVPFTDMEEGSWYAPYVAAAYQNGIVAGVSESRFGTGRPVTREDLAVMVYRSAQLRKIQLKEGQESGTFSDDGEISEYAKEAVYALRCAGVIQGMGDGGFAPAKTATRAEAAKILYGLAVYLW